MWYVYILLCRDSSFYTGISNKLQDRLRIHNQGKASKYTRSRRPVELIYAEKTYTKGEAKKRELQIKDLSRENKLRLIKFGSGQRFPSVQKILKREPRDRPSAINF